MREKRKIDESFVTISLKIPKLLDKKLTHWCTESDKFKGSTIVKAIEKFLNENDCES